MVALSPLPSMYVLDTNVLSELARKRPNPTVVDWVASEPTAMSIPFGAVIEIERGIVNLASRDISGAHLFSEWLGSLLASDIVFLPMDSDTARLYGRMTMVPALRDLWFPSTPPKKLKLGQDLSIAAVAIITGAPIATMNIKDFLRIDRYFPLPGLYNPAMSEWCIRPRVPPQRIKMCPHEKR
ncbi:PIN domain-containing protein [Mesorhizobium sp. CAU 1732]|uniref:PIN domain-containing protein n=1 Tax=Mesorhizobium sp. CAU 1732 TaxID=3140358 RepID=UPI00326137B6